MYEERPLRKTLFAVLVKSINLIALADQSMHRKENILEKIESVNEERYDCMAYTIFNPFCAGLSISPVIRKKSESQNECNKKTEHTKFSEKTSISYPVIRTSVSGVRNVRFFGKFDVLCVLVTFVLRFALLPLCRQFILMLSSIL